MFPNLMRTPLPICYLLCTVVYLSTEHNIRIELSGCDTIQGLQCSFHVCYGFSHHVVPAGVYVPGHSITAHLYGICRATAASAYTVYNRDSCQLSALQEAFQVQKKRFCINLIRN